MKELSPNKPVTSINTGRLRTPIKRKGISGWAKLIKTETKTKCLKKIENNMIGKDIQRKCKEK